MLYSLPGTAPPGRASVRCCQGRRARRPSAVTGDARPLTDPGCARTLNTSSARAGRTRPARLRAAAGSAKPAKEAETGQHAQGAGIDIAAWLTGIGFERAAGAGEIYRSGRALVEIEGGRVTVYAGKRGQRGPWHAAFSPGAPSWAVAAAVRAAAAPAPAPAPAAGGRRPSVPRGGGPPADSLLLRRAMRRHRKEAGLSVVGAAALFGLDPSGYSRAETGARAPFSAYAQSRMFGIPPARVLEPCPRCAYAPPPGYTCDRCGASDRDPRACRACGYQAGTDQEIRYHSREARHPDLQPPLRRRTRGEPSEDMEPGDGISR
jgi:hypothetical protein